jgi:hypothetical protein
MLLRAAFGMLLPQADGGELAAAICAASAALADAAIEQTDMLPACSVVSYKMLFCTVLLMPGLIPHSHWICQCSTS